MHSKYLLVIYDNEQYGKYIQMCTPKIISSFSPKIRIIIIKTSVTFIYVFLPLSIFTFIIPHLLSALFTCSNVLWFFTTMYTHLLYQYLFYVYNISSNYGFKIRVDLSLITSTWSLEASNIIDVMNPK